MSSEIDQVSYFSNHMRTIVEYYLFRRRQTVIQALIDIFPELVVYLGLQKMFPEISFPNVEREFRRELQITGIWADSWSYELHGMGCHLREINTGESFDWDMGDPKMFYLGELELHLEWRCKNEVQKPEITTYLNWGKSFKELLNYLLVNKFIQEKERYEWYLAP